MRPTRVKCSFLVSKWETTQCMPKKKMYPQVLWIALKNKEDNTGKNWGYRKFCLYMNSEVH